MNMKDEHWKPRLPESLSFRTGFHCVMAEERERPIVQIGKAEVESTTKDRYGWMLARNRAGAGAGVEMLFTPNRRTRMICILVIKRFIILWRH